MSLYLLGLKYFQNLLDVWCYSVIVNHLVCITKLFIVKKLLTTTNTLKIQGPTSEPVGSYGGECRLRAEHVKIKTGYLVILTDVVGGHFAAPVATGWKLPVCFGIDLLSPWWECDEVVLPQIPLLTINAPIVWGILWCAVVCVDVAHWTGVVFGGALWQWSRGCGSALSPYVSSCAWTPWKRH